MNVIEVEINALSPDPANVRRHTDAQIQKLMGMLKRWGQTLPLLVDMTGVVRVGNARLEAMRRLGWPRVKIVQLDLPPSEWTALAIADNRSHDESTFDNEALAEVLAALHAEDAGLAEATGYSPDELAALIAPPADAEPVAPAEFPAVDENIQTDHQCPKCGYVWSGNSAVTPQEEAA